VSATDFAAWVTPDLELPLPGGRIYTVRPPSVEAAKKIIACAVRAEVNLGLVAGEVPAEVQEILATIGKDEHPALGDEVYQQLVADGVDPWTIDKMAVYAIFFWARGREYADTLARIMWTPRDVGATKAGESAPKG
jgi:hypothetical protein